MICSLKEQRCFSATEGLCRHSSSSRLLKLVEEQCLGVRAISASVPIHRAYLLSLSERCRFSARGDTNTKVKSVNLFQTQASQLDASLAKIELG